ncbi:hypothetical protein MIR68_007401 [Amoeboaphelidium protococcarum]|nr:hypothetical protein MIR68_007401 [Amoeboaphelidium protococcarum]
MSTSSIGQTLIERYRSANGDDGKLKLLQTLDGIRNKDFDILYNDMRQMNDESHGLDALIKLRMDILRFEKSGESGLSQLSQRFILKFQLEFGSSNLTTIRVTQDSALGLKQQLVKYEKVHKVRSDQDAARRLGSCRRVFALTHKDWPSQILCFVNVALTENVATSIDSIVQASSDAQILNQDERQMQWAMFYSINSTLAGLGGIDLGHEMIMRAVTELRRSLPELQHFCTLSPIPSLAQNLKAEDTNEQSVLQFLCRRKDTSKASAPNKGPVLDPVANFHLKNGAMIYQINHGANLGVKGQQESYGFMVNYYYDQKSLRKNSELYIKRGKIALSDKLQSTLQLQSKL